VSQLMNMKRILKSVDEAESVDEHEEDPEV
jgi:hypothetical protein